MRGWIAAAVLGAGLTAGLSGCGAGAEGEASGEERLVALVGGVGRVAGGLQRDTGLALPRTVPGGFEAAQIAADVGSYRFVQVNAAGIAAPARVVEQGGGRRTLLLQTGQSAVFEGDLLVGTRGFGDDLLTMAAPGLPRVLAAGGGPLTRRMESLDDQDQVVTEDLSCVVAAAGAEAVDLGTRQVAARRLDETCEGETVIVENIWWLDEAGRVVASRQYVSPSVAYLRSNLL